MSLASLIDLDLSDEIGRLPKKSGHRTLAERVRERYVTLHYSGVIYEDRAEAAELKRIINEAAEHLRRDWGNGRGVYGDGYMYDLVVLTNGKIVRTRKRRQQLWHCGNETGNEQSWSVHVLLGPGQVLSEPQRASLFRLFDALRAESDIPRQNVVGHNEWPRGDGLPQPSATYRMLFQQSECPGRLIHADLVAYRAESDAPPLRRYIVTHEVAVREAPRADAPIAWGGSCILPAGREDELRPVDANWYHWEPAGFVPGGALAPAPAPGRYCEYNAILGAPKATLAQAVRYVMSRPHGEYSAWDIAQVILPRYWELCAEVGLDPVLAVAQMIHETGNLCSALSQRRDRHGNDLRNPAGIGVTGDVSPGPAAGFVWDADRRQYRRCVGFTDWATGSIPAHLGRLLAYALPPERRDERQQALVDLALSYRDLHPAAHGTAPNLKPLGAIHNPANAGKPREQWVAGWAWDGLDYGARIAGIANAICALSV